MKSCSATVQTGLFVQTVPNANSQSQKELTLSIWMQKLMKTAPVTCLLHEISLQFKGQKTVNFNENFVSA